MPEQANVEIYGLAGPDGRIRYIGKAKCAKTRLAGHLRERRRKYPVYRWIAKLKMQGLQPSLTIIESCSENEWPERERAIIAEYREVTPDLLNVADGGDQPKTNRRQLQGNAEKLNTRMAKYPHWKSALRRLGQDLRFLANHKASSERIQRQEEIMQRLRSMDEEQRAAFSRIAEKTGDVWI